MKQYAILINYMKSPITATSKRIEDVMSVFGMDWLRLGTGQYLCSTIFDSEHIYNQIKPLLLPDDYLFIVEINLSERRGWATKVAIDWISRVSP